MPTGVRVLILQSGIFGDPDVDYQGEVYNMELMCCIIGTYQSIAKELWTLTRSHLDKMQNSEKENWWNLDHLHNQCFETAFYLHLVQIKKIYLHYLFYNKKQV